MTQQWAKWIIIIGLILVVIGGVFYFFGDKLKWVGNLPGDIRIERDNVHIYIPIATLLIFSVLLSLLIRLINHLK